MSEALTAEAVRRVALLARLECSDEEVERFRRDLSAILGYVEKLNELDTEAVKPTSHALRQVNRFREDVARPSLASAEALQNAPAQEADHFKVPPIIQEM